MLANRSVPADIVLPHIVYQDVAAAIQWLSSAFGFVEHYRYGESCGAQMHLGDAWIMVRKARPGEATPSDVEAHYQRAKAAGTKIVEELNETPTESFNIEARTSMADFSRGMHGS